jgi:ribosomal protein S18 acetylase RimI-like enzyme
VTFGKGPSAEEVEVFLRSKAVMLEERGEAATTVFLHPTEEEVVGFYTTRGIKLTLDDEFREAFDISKTKARKLPESFDACYLIAIGINEKYQGKGYAPEIHAHLVESLTTGAMRPPYIFLKVWRDNENAVWLYDEWEYTTLDEEMAVRSTDGKELPRLLMVLKVRD